MQSEMSHSALYSYRTTPCIFQHEQVHWQIVVTKRGSVTLKIQRSSNLTKKLHQTGKSALLMTPFTIVNITVPSCREVLHVLQV